MSFLKRFFQTQDPRDSMRALYIQIIGKARESHWYEQGDVPDTLDGRFDMMAVVLSLILLRLEDDDGARQESAWLTEIFIDDMDSQLRELGIGDVIVGKHIGKMMSALGGRIGAYRDSLNGGDDFGAVVIRNVFRGEEPAKPALVHVEAKLRDVYNALKQAEVADLIKGEAVL